MRAQRCENLTAVVALAANTLFVNLGNRRKRSEYSNNKSIKLHIHFHVDTVSPNNVNVDAHERYQVSKD